MIWSCLKCGECCKSYVLSPKEANNIFAVIRGDLKKEFQEGLIRRHDNSNYLFWPHRCLFLENGECTIYDIRPSNCRNFMCGRRSMIEMVRIQGARCLNHEERYARDGEYLKFYGENKDRVYNEWSMYNGW